MKLSEKIKRSIGGRERIEEVEAEPSMALFVDKQTSYLSDTENNTLKELLLDNQDGSRDITEDFNTLASITSEIKSINHQSVLLHGERIQAAQELFKTYGELAFSRWLKEVYGNRQTPYNFLKYHLFFTSLDKRLQDKMLTMPKQIIYTIASRNCSEEDKQRVIDTYDGESKETYLKAIRKAFPLKKKDRRQKRSNVSARQIELMLEEITDVIDEHRSKFSLEELRSIDSRAKILVKHLWE
ncbi:MAG: hypothetical protein S4CHLAM20_05300 [Chlamydiia bacterium]|nr:hypothetical protein [Chlamydiia bacterium]